MVPRDQENSDFSHGIGRSRKYGATTGGRVRVPSRRFTESVHGDRTVGQEVSPPTEFQPHFLYLHDSGLLGNFYRSQ